MNLSAVDIVVIIVYMAGIGAMGLYFAKRNVNTEEYFVGGDRTRGGSSVCRWWRPRSARFRSWPFRATPTRRPICGCSRISCLPVALVVAAYVFLALLPQEPHCFGLRISRVAVRAGDPRLRRGGVHRSAN